MSQRLTPRIHFMTNPFGLVIFSQLKEEYQTTNGTRASPTTASMSACAGASLKIILGTERSPNEIFEIMARKKT